MAQIIEVRFLHPGDGSDIYDWYTASSSHREAITHALIEWSVGHATLTEMEVIKEEQFVPVGGNPHWQTQYVLTFTDDTREGEFELIAALFAEHKEKV